MKDAKTCLIFTQGAALGWYVADLSGLRKIKSDFMGSVFYSPAILVTLKSKGGTLNKYLVDLVKPGFVDKYQLKQKKWGTDLTCTPSYYVYFIYCQSTMVI